MTSLVKRFDNNFYPWLHYLWTSLANRLTSDQTIFMSHIPFYFRADSRFVPSQWETALFCYDVSHWLVANLESALYVSHLDMSRPYLVLCVKFVEWYINADGIVLNVNIVISSCYILSSNHGDLIIISLLCAKTIISYLYITYMHIGGLWHKSQASWAGMCNYTRHVAVGCNHLWIQAIHWLS